MDTALPIKSVVPSLDGPVLQVLAGTTRPLTAPEVMKIAGTGSLNGIRRVLARLAVQGVVTAKEHAAAIFYEANRCHLAWPAVELLAGIRRTLLDQLRAELERWEIQPIHASIFGSMARGDGDAESDIDILLVRPSATEEDGAPWAGQVDVLRRKVREWTGNHCQTFQLDMERLHQHVSAGDPLVREWSRDSVLLTGPHFKALLRQLPSGGR